MTDTTLVGWIDEIVDTLAGIRLHRLMYPRN